MAVVDVLLCLLKAENGVIAQMLGTFSGEILSKLIVWVRKIVREKVAGVLTKCSMHS